MTTKKLLLLGCGCALLVALGAVGLVVGWVVYIAQDPPGIAVSVEAPLDVGQGQIFPLTVEVRNERAGTAMKLTDIDISSRYLRSFVVVGTEPRAKATTGNEPFDSTRSFTFNTTIPAGQTRSFLFKFRAEKAGTFRGDIDVCEGSRFITAVAETVVKPAAHATAVAPTGAAGDNE